jgi:hypothetical protein
MSEDDSPALDTLVVYVPQEALQRVLDAVFAAGAGAMGRYRECAFVSAGRGQFRPLAGADPAIGAVGELEYVDEQRIEVVLPSTLRAAVVTAMRAAHPYEEPAFYVVAHAPS